jgi:D-serine deaminase-like pyridoxal phosphate-dependent protein
MGGIVFLCVMYALFRAIYMENIVKKFPKGLRHVETPELEVVVRMDQQELAVIAFFKDGDEGWDVLVGISDPTQRDAIASAIDAARSALVDAAFTAYAPPTNDGGDYTPPF